MNGRNSENLLTGTGRKDTGRKVPDVRTISSVMMRRSTYPVLFPLSHEQIRWTNEAIERNGSQSARQKSRDG